MMILRIFKEDLLIKKTELLENVKYRIGSDKQCEILLETAFGFEGELLYENKKWIYKKLKDKIGVEFPCGDELIIGNYKLKSAKPILQDSNSSVEGKTISVFNNSTIVIDRETTAKLVFLDEKYKGKEVKIEKPIFTIGRVAGNNLLVQDESVSKNHCRIIKKNGIYIVEDFDSTNGTFINGNKISEAELSEGDVLEVGLAKFQFWKGENIYKPPKKRFFNEEKTIIKEKLHVNKKIITLVILIIIAVGLLAIPVKKKNSKFVNNHVIREVTDNVIIDSNSLISDQNKNGIYNGVTTVEKTVKTKSSDKINNKKEKTEELFTEKVKIGRKNSEKTVRKRKKGKKNYQLKKTERVFKWRNVSCKNIWDRYLEVKNDFNKSVELQSKVFTCGEISVRELLKNGDFQQALSVSNNVKKIAGKLPLSIVSLFDKKIKPVFRQAYIMENIDMDMAKETYRKIIKMTPYESNYHKKSIANLR